ncbi:MAG: cyclic-di-AMP receptor [Herpetosiphon sp.]
MKLVIAVIQRQDEPAVARVFNQQRIGMTRLGSQGGFLQEGNVTLLMAVEDQRVEETLNVIRRYCHTRTKLVAPLPPVAESGEFYPTTPIEVQVGGATIFVLKGDQVRL